MRSLFLPYRNVNETLKKISRVVSFDKISKYKIEIVDIINEKFKTENVKVKVRKLVTAFPGSYYSENKNILFRMD